MSSFEKVKLLIAVAATMVSCAQTIDAALWGTKGIVLEPVDDDNDISGGLATGTALLLLCCKLLLLILQY